MTMISPDTPALALILARAGSKGVPGKNRAVVAGRPCVEWTLDDAAAARSVGIIAVSTDDEQIASLARARSAIVISRPAALASDTARVDDAARHALQELERNRLIPVGLPRLPVVILYANVPVRPPGLIDRAVAMLASAAADSVQSYSPVGKYHPWWMARLDDSGVVRPWEGDVLNHNVFRRQDLPPAFVPDGGVLVVTRAGLFLQNQSNPNLGPHAFFGVDRRGVINPEGSVVDIDTGADLARAEAALILRRRGDQEGSKCRSGAVTSDAGCRRL